MKRLLHQILQYLQLGSRPERPALTHDHPHDVGPADIPEILTPEQVGSALFSTFAKIEELDGARDELARSVDIDRNSFNWELWYLRAFAVECALQVFYGNEAVVSRVLTSFYSHYNKVFELYPAVKATHDARRQEYVHAWHTNHPATPLYAVGKVFARACGLDGCAVTAIEAVDLFTALLEGTKKGLSRIQLQE